MEKEDALKWELDELQTIIGRYDNFTYIIKGWCFTFYVGVITIIYTRDNGSALLYDWPVIYLLSFIILTFYALEVHYRIVHTNCKERSEKIQKVLLKKEGSEEPKTIKDTISEKGKHGAKYFFGQLSESLVNGRVTNIYTILTVPTLVFILALLSKTDKQITWVSIGYLVVVVLIFSKVLIMQIQNNREEIEKKLRDLWVKIGV